MAWAMLRLRALVWTLTLLVCASTARAQAEPAPSPATQAPATPGDARGEARVRFVRGVALAKSENWDEALAEFGASLELFRTSAALQNQAVCLTKLRRYVEARDAYAALLREFGPRLSETERSAIHAELGDLDALVGELVIASEPSQVRVVLNGRYVGETPLAGPVRVNAGTHLLRFSRSDYEGLEQSVAVAGAQRRGVRVTLQPLRSMGTLVVREAAGKSLDVVIDGAVVGRTPWRGQLSPGLHSAALRGAPNVGSLPSSAHVRADRTATLVLRALPLDASLSVIPTPPDASVFVDGVWVGNGVWEGRLPAGAHRVELAARGHVAARRELELPRGRSEELRVTLERDLSAPLWSRGFAPRAYVEAMGAFAWAPSFRGSAESGCESQVLDLEGTSRSGCTDARDPLGAAAALHVGYQLTPALGVEVSLAYLSLSAHQRRRVAATLESGPAYADGASDETSLRGPAVGVAASYRLPALPLRVRLSAGVLRGRVETSHRGVYAGRLANNHDFERSVRFTEEPQNLWIPFLGPELGFVYPLGERLEIGGGLAAVLFLPGETPRTGSDPALARVSGRRRRILVPQTERLNDGTEVNLGNLELPRERALSTFWALLPNVRLRASF